MKKFLNILAFLAVASSLFAQAPQGIPYQAIARNSGGSILASQPIRVRFTVHDSVATGAVVYQETFVPTTNTLGLFNVNVGAGSVVSGTFSAINWGHNAKYMQVEMDPTGGTTYTDMGTQQMMSVPYALYAGNSGGIVTAGGTYYITTTTPYNFSGSINCFSGGNIISDGGYAVMSRGVCWSTSHNPSIALITKTVDGSGVGNFTSAVSGLVPATVYYFRAYLTNVTGTYYGNEVAVTTPPFTIGMSYGGGTVFYIDFSGIHGLIAATVDQGSSQQWGPTPLFFGATGTSIGTGLTNTNIVVGAYGLSFTAAGLCRSYSGGGFTDWFLPSKDELNLMYVQRSLLGMTGTYYWSSSESDANNAWLEGFASSSGSGAFNFKWNSLYVRAIRSF